jgi:hypothetical protein
MREEVERGVRGAAVEGFDADDDVFGVGLGVFDDDVEVAVVVEEARVEQLVLGAVIAPAGAVLADQLRVGVLSLRVLVEELHVGVRGRRVEVEVILLDVLAVVALVAVEAEEALLQDRVAAVPECEREAEQLVAVAEAGEPVLAPAVSLRARQVVGEVVPRVAVGAVVLAHGAPRAFGDVRPPTPPRRDWRVDRLVESFMFFCRHEIRRGRGKWLNEELWGRGKSAARRRSVDPTSS